MHDYLARLKIKTSREEMPNLFDILGPLSTFVSHFASKCYRQSSDSTQFTYESPLDNSCLKRRKTNGPVFETALLVDVCIFECSFITLSQHFC